MLRHIIFHKRCLTIYNKLGLKCLKLPVLYADKGWQYRKKDLTKKIFLEYAEYFLHLIWKNLTFLIGDMSPKKSTFLRPPLREDPHKKSVFFSGLTSKGVERVNPPDH